MRLPGSKTKLLEQKIPATYLALEDVVGGIASELRAGGNDPVLNQVHEIAKIKFLYMMFLKSIRYEALYLKLPFFSGAI